MEALFTPVTPRGWYKRVKKNSATSLTARASALSFEKVFVDNPIYYSGKHV